jgi:asparagine N-glycosylation enzyme membrane subunit Stt3
VYIFIDNPLGFQSGFSRGLFRVFGISRVWISLKFFNGDILLSLLISFEVLFCLGFVYPSKPSLGLSTVP